MNRFDRSLRVTLASVALSLAASSAATAGFDFECPIFTRGDSNADGGFNIADPVFTLNFLFADGDTPSCLDAADTDDSGRVNIADATFALNVLFGGQGEIPAPGPNECGRDPTSNDELSCESFLPCEPATESRDFSAFEVFTYRQGPGLGFCPENESILHATIRETDEGYELEHSTLAVVEEPPPGGECIPEWVGDPPGCLIEVVQEPRLLTGVELTLLLDAFERVFFRVGTDPACWCIAFDPCRVRRFEWDGFAIDGFLCSTRHFEAAEENALTDVLETLKTPPAAGGDEDQLPPPDTDR